MSEKECKHKWKLIVSPPDWYTGDAVEQREYYICEKCGEEKEIHE